MRLPWFLFLAIKQLLPSGKRFGTIFFWLSVLGVALGVGVLIIVQSVMGGFGTIHRERILNTTGHLDINMGGYPYNMDQAAFDWLETSESIEIITPYAQGFVMAKKGRVPTFPAIYGIDASHPPVFKLQDFMVSGSIDDLYDDTVLISRKLGMEIGAFVGSEIELYSPLMVEAMSGDEVIFPGVFTVAGVYDVEWNQSFIPGIICTLPVMQDMYGLGDRIHGVGIRLKEGVDEHAFRNEVKLQLPDWLDVITWKERWADFLWVLDLEKTMMLFLNLFIVAVAAFAIAIAQLLTVVRKGREIGVLQVIGSSTKGIMAIYAFQGLFIGLMGSVAGILGALFFLQVRDPIISLIAELSGTKETLVKFYYFSHLPVKYEPTTFIIVCLLAIALATLASLIPAYRASRMKAADTIRLEI